MTRWFFLIFLKINFHAVLFVSFGLWSVSFWPQVTPFSLNYFGFRHFVLDRVPTAGRLFSSQGAVVFLNFWVDFRVFFLRLISFFKFFSQRNGSWFRHFLTKEI